MKNTHKGNTFSKLLVASALLSVSAMSLAAEESEWKSDIGAGLNFKSGNTERFDASFSAKTSKETKEDRILFSYLGVFSESTDSDTDESSVTDRNHRLNASYDWNFSEDMFFRLPTFEYYTDEFKNITHQATLGVAVGYKIYKEDNFKLDVYAGPSVQHTEFTDVEDGVDDTETTPVLSIGTKLDYVIAENISYFLTYDGKIVSEEAGEFIHHLETGFNVALMGNLSLHAKAILDRTDNPIADSDGDRPDKNDQLVIVGLKYSF